MQIELPWPDSRLSPNSRLSWRAKMQFTEQAKNTGWAAALPCRDGFKDGKQLEARYILHPPDRRRRDQDNVLAALKPAVDGVCSALGIDDSRIKRTVIEWEEPRKPGMVIMELEKIE